MAAISGKKGTVSWAGGSVSAFDNWSIDTNVNMLETTVFSTGTVQWKTFVDGLSDWSGTISGNYDSASTGLDDMIVATITPSTGTVLLDIDKDAGGSLTGSVFISSMGIAVPIDGKATASFSVQGTGALTYSTTT